MTDRALKVDHSDLSSRRSGAELRQRILGRVEAERPVVVDLRGVLSVSESYADEAFGVLVKHYGLEWFLDSVQLVTEQDPVLESIATALLRRSHLSGDEATR